MKTTPRKVPQSGMIGCNIRKGMIPGGFTKILGQSTPEKDRRHNERHAPRTARPKPDVIFVEDPICPPVLDEILIARQANPAAGPLFTPLTPEEFVRLARNEPPLLPTLRIEIVPEPPHA